MLKLGAAGFPTADAKLLPSAGACGACPKRTGNQPELFGDVKGADVCTDPTCYRAKRDAWTRVRLDQARATGKRVIEGKEAKKLSPYGSAHHLEGGYVSLDAHCYEDAKNRTYRQLLGKGAETELLLLPGKRDDDEDTLVEIVKKSAVATALKDKGVKAPARDDRYAREQAATAKKVKLEQAYRVELVKRLQAARLEQLGEEAWALSLMELRAVLDAFFDRLDGDAQARIAKVWGIEATKGKSGYGKEYSPPCTDPHRAARLILDCTYATDLHVSSYALKEKPTRLLAAAVRYGVLLLLLHLDDRGHHAAARRGAGGAQRAGLQPPRQVGASLVCNWIRVRKFCELTGYTDDAVRRKIADGVWLEGRVWRKAPDGAIVISQRGYDTWAEGQESAPQGRVPFRSTSDTAASDVGKS